MGKLLLRIQLGVCTLGLLGVVAWIAYAGSNLSPAKQKAGAGVDRELEALLDLKLLVQAESPYKLGRHLQAEGASNAVSKAAALSRTAVPAFSAKGPLEALVRGLQAQVEVSASSDADDGPSPGDLGVSCNDAHPNADSPDMLHVVYASDVQQVEGVQASVASVVSSAAKPEELTIHIMVQNKFAKEFKERFGLHPICQGTVTVTGVLIRVHSVDPKLIEKAIAKIPQNVKKERGAIDVIENFARFYMHKVLPDKAQVVVYLDADTIVQADLAQLRNQLLQSGKTAGFVKRSTTVLMEMFLRTPKDCEWEGRARWKRLMKRSAYNVGVFAVNLQRWQETHALERVEAIIAAHNRCNGRLWVGGSQPPLLLAFLDHPEDQPDDFVVFDSAWNAGDLGWKKDLNKGKLSTKSVLHWNGNKKPWKEGGLYQDLWLPHRQRFDSLLKPYESGGKSKSKRSSAVVDPRRPVATSTLSPEEVAAQEACPSVRLLDDWSDPGLSIRSRSCIMGSSFGCGGEGSSVWTSGPCAGLFSVKEKPTVCGHAGPAVCASGSLPAPSHGCGLMLLTTYITTKKDWQRGKFARVQYSKVRRLYHSTVTKGINVTVLYDKLPVDFMQKYGNERFNFHQVDLTTFDKRYGVNDVRYFFFLQLIKAHPEWKTIFIVDLFDVRVPMNPCPGIQDGRLYVGKEQDRLRRHPWMKARFLRMGGHYVEWYSTLGEQTRILNCGITGGRRDVMLRLVSRMTQVLEDPNLEIRKKGKEDINLNMAALNYIVYNEFPDFISGAPLHSVYKRFENRRKDVWFIHK